MTIAITCNVSDGVILGADSAQTIGGRVVPQESIDQQRQEGVLKTYKSSKKLFQLSQYIGLTTFGLGMIGPRTVGSYVNEFIINNKDYLEGHDNVNVEEVCKKVRDFFSEIYSNKIKPQVEQSFNKSFDQLPDNVIPKINFQVAGFSNNNALSEVWQIDVPLHNSRSDLRLLREPGQFGSNWSGMIAPVSRLIKGYDSNLMEEIFNFITQKFDVQIDEETNEQIKKILGKYESRIIYDPMPIQEGIDHVKFLLNTVIHNTRFVIGAPICDAPISIAVITSDRGFQYIEEPKYVVTI